MRYGNKRGQAIVELGVFGSIILILLGTLLSYLQRANEQQYVQMEAFRRALVVAHNYDDPKTQENDGGASAQYTLIQDRRGIDLFSGFQKGSPQRLSASNSLSWAIPPVGVDGARTQSVYVFRVNEDELVKNPRKDRDHEDGFIPEEHESVDRDGNERQRYWVFETTDLDSTSTLNFGEQINKLESSQAILNSRGSNLQETVDTQIPYVIKEKDKDDYDYEKIILGGPEDKKVLWEPIQGLYRDPSDGQYKYSAAKVGTTVKRQKTWVTDFPKD